MKKDLENAFNKALAATSRDHNKTREDSEILAGIPSGVWADHWRTEQEEKGRSFSGKNLIEEAPSPPAWARKWAKALAQKIVEANGKSLEALYHYVRNNGYPHDRHHFGYHLGMQAVGHGVSWSDDCNLPYSAIKIPHDEFYRR